MGMRASRVSAWFLRVSLLSGRAHNLESAGPKPRPDRRLTVESRPVEQVFPGIFTDTRIYVQCYRHELMHFYPDTLTHLRVLPEPKQTSAHPVCPENHAPGAR